MVLDTSTHKLVYHYLDSPNTADYVYDPTTNIWVRVTSSGTLPIWNSGCTGSCNVGSGIATLYDPLTNTIIAWNEGSTSTLWQGAISGSGGGSPTVTITAPTSGASLMGTATLSATASGSLSITQVQFQLDGANLGAPVPGPGSSYSTTWDTTTVTNGNHNLTALATDSGGNTGTSGIVSVTVSNPVVPPAISGVAANSIGPSSATIVWTTNQASTSQVAYGTTTAYGSITAQNNTLVTSHSVNLSNLAASTTYHYQVLSQNAQGGQSASGDFMLTTTAQSNGPQTLLLLHADATEVSGTTNGAVVTPAIAPSGFTGTVVANGSGSVNYAPGQTGNGVYFLNCCVNSNDAYYKFVGRTVGSIFNVTQGQISFYLKSRYSFAQRSATASSPRYAFDVRMRDGKRTPILFPDPGVIRPPAVQLRRGVGGSMQYYFVPAGTENALYGNGVLLQVTLSWSGGTLNLYLNGTLVKTTAYTPVTPNWTTASNFDFGGYEYLTYGGYNISDDLIDEFTVSGPAIVVPTVSITAPSAGASLVGPVTLSANATDSLGVTQVQFQLDGTNLGAPVTGPGPSYSTSWDTTTATNGTHNLTAIATDAGGNTATSSIVSVMVNNPATPPVISGVAANSDRFFDRGYRVDHGPGQHLSGGLRNQQFLWLDHYPEQYVGDYAFGELIESDPFHHLSLPSAVTELTGRAERIG